MQICCKCFSTKITITENGLNYCTSCYPWKADLSQEEINNQFTEARIRINIENQKYISENLKRYGKKFI